MSDDQKRSAERRALDILERCLSNCHFKQRWSSYVSIGVLAAVALHFAGLKAFPEVKGEDYSGDDAEEQKLVEVPPTVEVPPPPERVARPAEPRVSTTDVRPDATISPTEMDEDPPRPDMPPPPSTRSTHGDRPSFIPRDVDPRLQNEAELQELLEEHYPPAMAEAGIGGRVMLWVFVDENGDVAKLQVKQSSGYDRLDDAARKVARQMDFEPAQAQEDAIGVWVSQAIRFDPAVTD